MDDLDRILSQDQANPRPGKKADRSKTSASDQANTNKNSTIPQTGLPNSSRPLTVAKPKKAPPPTRKRRGTVEKYIQMAGSPELPRAAMVEVRDGQQDAAESLKLSDGMRRVLLATLDPKTSGLNNERLAEHLGGITPQMVGKVRRNPVFLHALEAVVRDSLARFIPAILAAAIDTASRPGRDGHLDRKMLLKMAGYDDLDARTKGAAGSSSADRHLDARLQDAIARKEAALKRLRVEDLEDDDDGVVDAEWHEAGTDDETEPDDEEMSDG